MEVKTNNGNLKLHLKNEKIELCRHNDQGIVALTIPKKTTNERSYAVEMVLALLKKENQHLKITAIGFTPPNPDGSFECFINFEEKVSI